MKIVIIARSLCNDFDETRYAPAHIQTSVHSIFTNVCPAVLRGLLVSLVQTFPSSFPVPFLSHPHFSSILLDQTC